jgi:hypothetical protein
MVCPEFLFKFCGFHGKSLFSLGKRDLPIQRRKVYKISKVSIILAEVYNPSYLGG